MMPKKKLLTVQAKVIGPSKSAGYRVKLAEGHEADARLSGNMRYAFRKRKLESGDEVTVELSPYDLTQGRIVEARKGK